MSYNAFYFTMSPEDVKSVLAMSKEYAIKRLYEIEKESISTDTGFWGQELEAIINNCDMACDLSINSLTMKPNPNPKLQELLHETFGACGFYPLKSVKLMAENLAQVEVVSSKEGYMDWTGEITRILKEKDKEFLVDELIGVMLGITQIFQYAKDKGHIVISYWE